ncbi:MAG: hypothetical protein U0930_09460 [Pirellulales bacterium]
MNARIVIASLVLSTISTLAVAQETYKFEYKLKPGEQIVSKIYHEAQTQTNISGVQEDSSSQTTSIKVWDVQSATKNDITFVYSIDSVDMRQSIGGGEEVKYNSQTDQEAPRVFERVAETVQKPLATITINRVGEVLKRDNELKSPLMGIGDLTVPLPAEPVAVGAQWHVPRDLRVRLENGSFKIIKIREMYKLEKVSTGVYNSHGISATNARYRSGRRSSVDTAAQQGSIKFDLDNGRFLSKKLDWVRM